MLVVSFWQFIISLTSYLSPGIVAFIQNPLWPTWKKISASICFHTFIAAAYLGADGQFTSDLLTSGQQLLFVATQLFVFSSLSYMGLWKPRAINLKANALKTRSLKKLGLIPPDNPPSPADKPLSPVEVANVVSLPTTEKTK